METQADSPADGRDTFSLIAGSLCLDFVNTVGGLRGGQAREYLPTYADLVRWSQQAGLLPGDAADRLLEAADRGDEAQAVYARAVALREALYRLFVQLLDGTEPAPADLTTLNAELARALAHLALRFAPEEGFAWQWVGAEGALDRMLWPVARSAVDLLLSPTVRALHQCAGATCGWLFLDTTKNRSRRWCDMASCGNRTKVRRHRARKRDGSNT
jgi:predicted RNA-binding Zn ribbon-like protein